VFRDGEFVTARRAPCAANTMTFERGPSGQAGGPAVFSATPALWHHAAVKKAAASKKSPAATQEKTKGKTARRKPPAKKGAKGAPRADLGAPIDGFFSKQPAHLRPVLDELRKLVHEAAPDATSAMKWGLAFFSMGKHPMCALAGFKAHVNLILAGPPGTFADPDGILEGEGKTGRHLKLRALEDLPRAAVRGWLHTAAERARKQK
jgi:hypothetical protein